MDGIKKSDMKSKKYQFLEFNINTIKEYSLIPIRKSDMEIIRRWRNEQIIFLRQSNYLTKKQQEIYYNRFIKKSFLMDFPDIILFSVLLKKRLIGYGGFVHINWYSRRAELSFLNDTIRKQKQVYERDFSTFLEIILKIGFEDLNLNKITTETYNIRPNVIKVLEKFNFKKEGILKKHTKIGNEFVDSKLHAILRADYIKKKRV